MDPPLMADQRQDDQLEHTYSSYVRIRDVALETCQGRWMIRRSGERGSGISVLAARYDDDDCCKRLNAAEIVYDIMLLFIVCVCVCVCARARARTRDCRESRVAFFLQIYSSCNIYRNKLLLFHFSKIIFHFNPPSFLSFFIFFIFIP